MKKAILLMMILILVPSSIAFADAVQVGRGIDMFSGLKFHRTVSFNSEVYFSGLIISFILMTIILIIFTLIMRHKAVDKKIRKRIIILIILFFVGFEIFALIRGKRINGLRIMPERGYRSYQLEVITNNLRFLNFEGPNRSPKITKQLIETCNAWNLDNESTQKFGAVSIVLKEFDSEGITTKPETNIRINDEIKSSESVEMVNENLIKNSMGYYICISAYNVNGFVSEITIYKQKGMIASE